MINAKLRKLMFGTSLPQEYICVAKEKLLNQFHAFLFSDNGFTDITNEHIFLGYSPVIIGISSAKGATLNDLLNDRNETVIKFGETTDRIIAQLTLKKIEKISYGSVDFFLFEGINGSHKFLSAAYQIINSIKYILLAEKKKNIYLKGNLFQQVKIAYSIPRKISLVTLGNNGMFNIFPTDLNGRINNDHFLISLRKTGKAYQQVKEHRKLVISEILTESYREAYSYGVNHTRDLKQLEKFSFSEDLSESLKLPLPTNNLKYLELEFVDDMAIGIHNLIFFKIIKSFKTDNSNTLAHIHRDYAQWRINNNLQSELLIR